MSYMYIRIRLRSFYFSDFSLIEDSLRKLCTALKNTGSLQVSLSGATPLPVQKKLITVNRSVHADNKSKEQYYLKTRKRLWTLRLRPREYSQNDQCCVSKSVFFQGEAWTTFIRDLQCVQTAAFDWECKEGIGPL